MVADPVWGRGKGAGVEVFELRGGGAVEFWGVGQWGRGGKVVVMVEAAAGLIGCWEAFGARWIGGCFGESAGEDGADGGVWWGGGRWNKRAGWDECGFDVGCWVEGGCAVRFGYDKCVVDEMLIEWEDSVLLNGAFYPV